MKSERVLDECNDTEDAHHHKYSYGCVEDMLSSLLAFLGVVRISDKNPNTPDEIENSYGKQDLNCRVDDDSNDFCDERHSF
jgi:hypothetical protein